MKYQYTLIGMLMLIYYSAVPQPHDTYAAATSNEFRSAYSLKQALKEVEKSFKVSIAYKDEWVENKETKPAFNSYRSVEDALDKMLLNTNLYYEKAAERFYVIYEKKHVRASQAGESASVSTAPLTFSSTADAYETFVTEYLPELRKKADAAITVSGKITDENGNPFPGVNIIAKGTAIGTSSDSDGKYTLAVPDENTILVFSFIGYATQEVTVGSRTTIDFAMTPDIQSLDEVVVTALGIEKSTKSLGYATSKVSSEQLTVNRTPNLMNALQGKIAGVNISGLGTGPGGTSKIRIRGQSSIGGTNSPLIVVNGVPIDNTNFGTNPNNEGSEGSIGVRAGGGGGGNTSDGGDGLQSINPDDVESMTILKGAAAAALYGSRAKDGVIMITTKSKGDGKGIGITYNMNYTDEKPLDFTDYQYEYGQGEYDNTLGRVVRPNAPNPNTGQWSFGEKFEPGMTQILFDGVEVPYVPQRNIIDKFFRHGQNFTNTVTLSTGGDKGGMSLSLSNMESKGIMPNNSFNRKTINLGFTQELSTKLSFRGNINYSNEYNKNAPNIANQDNSIPTAIYNLANSMPLWLLDEKKFDAQGNEAYWSRFQNRANPYFILDKQFQNIRRDRLFGNISIKYNILPWLYVQGRIGQDYWSRDQDYNNFPTGVQSRARSTNPAFVDGQYTQESRRFREINADFLVSGKREFGNIGIDLTFGGNQLKRRMDLNSVLVTDFAVRDIYLPQFGRLKEPLYTLTEKSVNSLYGAAELSYKNFLFLNGTYRVDWFSTLSAGNRNIPYPSISLGYVFSEHFDAPQWMSFGKLRLAYASVGSDGDVAPYTNALYYGINGNLFAGQPVGAIGGPSPNSVPNATLRPMRVNEVEVGLDLKLFNNRLGIDLAAYNKFSYDQIIQAQISDGSGYLYSNINSGESRNKGVEALVNVVVIENESFSWEFTANTAYNITKVIKLQKDAEGESIRTAQHVFNGELRQIVGEEMGQLAGFGYRRDAEGRKIFGTDGLPLASTAMLLYGSALPKWVGGFNNAFNYKGITFSFLIDYKLGGKMISGTNFNAVRHGLHKMTLEGREGGVVGDGVNEAGEVNEIAAPNERYWETVRTRAIVEPIVYNSGYWKLRQITLGYDFTKFLPDQFPVKSIKLSFVANNVLILKKWVPNIDPETFGYSSDNLVGLESTGLPSTRSLGFNLNAKF
jgi:TonB-linked SusC/RagA family outer membrane protein